MSDCPKCVAGGDGELCPKHATGSWGAALPASLVLPASKFQPAEGPAAAKDLLCERCGADRTTEISRLAMEGARLGVGIAHRGLGVGKLGQMVAGALGAMLTGVALTSEASGRLCEKCRQGSCAHGVARKDGSFCKPCILAGAWPFTYPVGTAFCQHGVDARFDCPPCKGRAS